jgi:tetratricopeptide (TPR) repeat protein
MIEILLALLSGLVLLLIFFRRWYLLEKSTLFGKMVFKKGFRLSGKITKDDHEITPKEMIPDQSSVAPKLIVKGDTYFKKAELELKKGNTSEAEKLYIKSIAMDPSHIESHAKLGAIYLNQKQFGKAELIYRKLIVAVSDDPIYFSNLGLSLFHQEKYPEAKDNYDQAIALDPNRAGRFYSLARINHLLWPTSFFILTIFATVTPIINPVFKRTVMGFILPQISGLILTLGSSMLIVYTIVDILIRNKLDIKTKPQNIIILALQWYVLPIVSFFLSSVPALDAHTRLLFGKKLVYKVTEKK